MYGLHYSSIPVSGNARIWPLAILNSLSDAIIACDLAGRIQYMNASARSLIASGQLPAEELLVAELTGLLRASPTAPKLAPDTAPERINVGGAYSQYDDWGACNNIVSPLQLTAIPLRDGNDRIVGTAFHLRQWQDNAQVVHDLYYHATHDELTGLYNRREFTNRLKRLIDHRPPKGRHALLYMDLDHFKPVNDTCGHEAGDEALRQLASLLQSKLRARDSLARLGGDEFGLLLEHCPPEKALQTADALVQSVRNFNFRWRERPLQLGISIGLTLVGGRHRNLGSLLSEADHACYEAKRSGGDRVSVFSGDHPQIL